MAEGQFQGLKEQETDVSGIVLNKCGQSNVEEKQIFQLWDKSLNMERDTKRPSILEMLGRKISFWMWGPRKKSDLKVMSMI